VDLAKIADELDAIERRYAPGGDVSSAACRKQLAEWRTREADREEVCSAGNGPAAWLLLRLCVRYGIRPFRRPRQKPTTVCLHAPAGFVSKVLWPQVLDSARVFERAHAELTGDIITRWLGAAAADETLFVDEIKSPSR
jgi:hypothetical protein